MNRLKGSGQTGLSMRLSRSLNWIPIAVILTIMLLLMVKGSSKVYSAPDLLLGLNFLFSALTSLAVVGLVGHRFLAIGKPGLLLLGCGVAVLGSASPVALLAARGDINTAITIFNLCAWVSAILHLAGAITATRSTILIQTTKTCLAAALTIAAGLVGLIVVLAVDGGLPAFFIPGQGSTTVRNLVLGSAVTTFLLTAAILAAKPKVGSLSDFVHWYAMALLLLAMGLASVMLAPAFDSALSWTGRAAQHLGGIYMLVAVMSVMHTSKSCPVDLGAPSGLRNLPNLTAITLVLVATAVHLLLVETLNIQMAFVSFYFAVVLAVLYGGLRSGLLAAAVATVLASYTWLDPPFGVTAFNKLQWIDYIMFLTSSVLIVIIVDAKRSFQERAAAAETKIRIDAERAAATEEIRVRDERLQQVLLVSHSITFEWDPVTDRISRPEKCAGALGLNDAGKGLGTGAEYLELIHPDDRADYLSTLHSLTPDNDTYHHNYRVVYPDGEIVFLEENGRAYFGAQGKLQRVAGIATDVTLRERAHNALRASERLARQTAVRLARAETAVETINAMRESVIMLGPDGTIVSVNPAVETMVGIDSDKAIGKKIKPLLPVVLRGNDLRTAIQGLDELLDGRIPKIIPMRLHRPDATKVRILPSVTYINSPDSNRPLILLTLRDITELYNAEHKYRELVENANSIIMRINSGLVITFFNEYAQAFFGFSEPEVLGRKIQDSIIQETDEAFISFDRMSSPDARQSEVCPTCECEHICKDGRRVSVLWTNREMWDDRGKLWEILCVGTDITERKRIQSMNALYQKQRQRLAQQLADNESKERWQVSRYIHDTIVQNLSLASMRMESIGRNLARYGNGREAETLASTREIINEAISECRNVTSELTPPLLYEFGIVPAIEELARNLHLRYGIQVRVENVKSKVDTLTGINNSLRGFVFQAVRELLLNAIKHAGPCNVIVKIACRANTIMVRVMDDGKGFDASLIDCPQLQKGGLGLVSIRERLESLDGCLVLQSHPGQGTTASISLPV